MAKVKKGAGGADDIRRAKKIDKNNITDYSRQSKEQLEKAKTSYEKLIKEHEKKLADYKKSPYKYDNKGILKNSPNKEIADKIINGRIKALEKQIKKQKNELQKIMEWLKDK